MSSTEEPSDISLVDQAKSAPRGDLRAFDELIRRHEQRVLTNCRYLSGSADDAEDLAQGVFIKAFFGLGGFEGRSSFGTWIQRIKTNHCLNFIRSRRKGQVEIDDPNIQAEEAMQVSPQGPREATREAQRQEIKAVLDDMAETVRVPLIMRDLDGMSYQEIADLLGVSLSAVKMRIKRGREEFRERYARESRI